MKPYYKKRLLVDGDRLFGHLLLFKDAKDRISLKFTYENKAGFINKYWLSTGQFTDIKDTSLLSTKMVKDGESIDISYKFENSKLEFKRESRHSIERTLYDVIIPVNIFLFSLIVRNKDFLVQVESTPDDIILNPLGLGEQIGVVFSFCGSDGKPIMNEAISGRRGKQHILDLPGVLLNPLYIATVNDENIIRPEVDFLFSIPHTPTKIT